uniref:Uncharacterized protein n=1 Tax=Megaselia scalaris TaxID=36166 RepID=T1GPQ1_MEGSC
MVLLIQRKPKYSASNLYRILKTFHKNNKFFKLQVSYNAAGVLAHIASDGSRAWQIETPSREEVLHRMVNAIERWDLKSERNINYRSFEPILSLLKCYDTPQCQHWAVWCLTNLTEVYPEKYCILVIQEKGMDYLSELVEHPLPYDRIKELAQLVINRCLNYNVTPEIDGLVLVGVIMNPDMSLAHLKDLNYIDFTSCVLGNSTLESLTELPNLQTLILFSVWPISNHLPTICKIKTLHTLDISIVNQATGQGTYDQPDQKLEMLVLNLPNLTHLDISGTNLAGNGVARKVTTPEEKSKSIGSNFCVLSSDIPGLASRSQTPLQFLGLYQTEHYACKRHDIPAVEIAGEANEKQILTAAKYYHDRPIVLTKILNDLYHLFRFESCKEIYTALEGREKSKFGTTLKNHIITTLLNGMAVHITDDTMLRNGYLTLTQFSMPSDVLFEYERLIKILLHGVSKTEGFVQRIAIYLLNTLACQVDGRQKLVLGELGVISTMLNLIKNRLDRSMFDDVLEVAWSTMWNVTDETAINCKKFLEGQGMEYFLRCLKAFPEKEELLRNMMGLLGNVAEVKWLRPNLMTSEFIKVFSDLLDSISDGIEVSILNIDFVFIIFFFEIELIFFLDNNFTSFISFKF